MAPPPASEPPPPFQSPAATPNDAPNYNNRREGTDPVRTRMVRSTPQMTRQQRAAASRGEQDLVSDDESSSDDFKVETVVVHKKDLDKLKNQHPEAPFRLPPPGAGIGPDRGSIPGAPWARGNRVDIKVRPAIADELTMDAVHHDSRDEGDGESSDDEGETYRDAGGLPSLAAALGLSPGDPRLQSLQRGRDPNAGFDIDRRALDRRANEDDVPTSSRRKR
ncbi:MAG: hypothetical protein JNK04_25090 [Myxococcales bacterium]|nr:hypothetical protein [Myxococcales bacterium]